MALGWYCNSSLVSPLATTPSEPWTPSSTTSSGSSDPEGSSSAASSSGSISPVAAAANQTAAAMAASAHARLATEFGKGGKFKLAKDPRAHSAPAAAQHRKAEGEAGNEEERWLYVMPRQRVRPRECDEVPDEFRRAGIGLCFGGTATADSEEGASRYDVCIGGSLQI